VIEHGPRASFVAPIAANRLRAPSQRFCPTATSGGGKQGIAGPVVSPHEVQNGVHGVPYDS
jgi:hypothetical protein